LMEGLWVVGRASAYKNEEQTAEGAASEQPTPF
jgi:hypothetical protein